MSLTWSESFAAQAASDFAVFKILATSSGPACHRLHYLQMWLEKLCKAYIWLPGKSAEELRIRHNVVDKVFPRLIAEYWRKIGFPKRPDLAAIHSLCREIDLLHPQVDDGERRPDNVEYPWLGRQGEILIPATWNFPLLRRLYTPSGRLLLKAAETLTSNTSIFRD